MADVCTHSVPVLACQLFFQEQESVNMKDKPFDCVERIGDITAGQIKAMQTIMVSTK